MDTNRHETLAGDGNAPGSLNGSRETAANGSGYNFPNSKRIYLGAELHRDVRVPFREISLAPTKSMNGETEVNEPVRVYDTSGAWGDPSVTIDPAQGLPPLRRDWILKRGDVDEIEGRVVRPIDDGYLSDKHAAIAVKRPTFNGAGAPSRRKPLRASAGHPVTQLWYARQGHRHARDGIHRYSGEWPRNRESRIENRTKRFTVHESRITQRTCVPTSRRIIRSKHPTRNNT